MQDSEQDAGAQRQRELFWFNEPHLVIALIQFMQFGYAIALSIVIMFWENLGELEPYYYLLITFGCYSTFVFVLAKVLPQYTLCTSLGHLVNKQHLNETLALHRLKEAQRRQKQKMFQLTFGDDIDDSIICLKSKKENIAIVMEMDNKAPLAHQESGGLSTAQTLSSASISESGSNQEHRLLMRKVSSSENIAESESSDSAIYAPSHPDFLKTRQSSLVDSTLLAELVKMDTSQLRQQLPERNQARMSERDESMRQRRANRKKAVSDGVQAMRGMGNVMSPAAMNIFQNTTNAAEMTPSPKAIRPKSNGSMDDAEVGQQDRAARLANRRANRKKSVSASGVIQAWRSIDDKDNNKQKTVPLSSITEQPKVMPRHERKKSASASDIVQSWQGTTLLEDGPKFVLKNASNQKTTDDPVELHRRLRNERLALQREHRRKSVSASAVIQSWRDFSITDPPIKSESLNRGRSISPMRAESVESNQPTSKTLQNTEDITIMYPAMASEDNNQEPSDEHVTLVNLSDAKLILVDNDDLPATRKSVGFSEDLERTTDDDSLIRKPATDDDSTVDTGRSVGELSDVGAITRSEFESLHSAYHWEKPWYVKLQQRLAPTSIKKQLHDIFMSERYPLISHVFGSIVVFFLIGMRVETFNAVLGLYDQSENTWELRLNVSFWWQATWYMLFVIVSALVMWSVHPTENKSIAAKRIFAAAVIDLFLSTACLTLLFVAESQRCCEDETYYEDGFIRRFYRLLAGESYPNASDSYANETKGAYEAYDAYGAATKTNVYDDDVFKQCCPFWGFRTFGGLGNIEPFTSLIGLRVLRFHVAKLFLKKMKNEGTKEAGSHASTDQEHSAEDHDHDHHAGHSHGHGHGHGHNVHEKGTALELWQQAINKYPHIVEKYGHFSGELFQAMLGLDIIEEQNQKPRSNPITPAVSIGDLQELVDATPDKTSTTSNPHYKLNGDQYSALSAECQGIILAGKLGKPVKSMPNLFEHFASDGNLPTLHEDSGGEEHDTPSKVPGPKNLEFEVDSDLLAREQNDDSMFIAPSARLIRSMRRCDRRLYPLLKEWIPVDVVITDYEIVYFEVENDVYEHSLPEEVQQKKQALRLALQATKGGKGLRLMDVAAGRKVVGHLDLNDVTQVYVERDMPILDASHLEANESNLDVLNQVPSEYWQKPSHVEVHTHSRALRWAKVKEDRLKLVSIHGTLFLRYYSDLNDVESHSVASQVENELYGLLRKDIAFQWAQTVAHICGTDQLKQPLPHFGNNASDELRDYLEIVHHKIDESKGHKRVKSGHLGASFPPNELVILHDVEGTPSAPKPISKPRLRYSKSLGESDTERPMSFRIFRRSSSIGEPDSDPPPIPIVDGGLDGVVVASKKTDDQNEDSEIVLA